MPYFLVFLHPADGDQELPDHEPFVDSLVERNLVVLGGDLDPTESGATAAYVLATSSLFAAKELASGDPLVSSGCMRAEVVEWHLVGLNPDAVEPALHLRPDDIVTDST